MAKTEDMAIIAGNSIPNMAQRIARRTRSGFFSGKLLKTEIEKFSDGEIMVELFDSVRGKNAYIIQSTCAPVNDNFMEMLLIADALKRCAAKSITAVIPYIGYSRQDRQPKLRRVPITASLTAELIEAAGIDTVVTVDVHAAQIQGMYRIPFLNLGAASIFTADIYHAYDDPVIVSPDAGGVERARSVAKQLGYELAVIDKRRPKHNESEVMNILGDVDGKECVIIDDMVDTAGTLCKGAAALMEGGAKSVSAYCTHAVLSGDALTNINNSVLKEMVVTDTIPLMKKKELCDKLRVVSVADLLNETLVRIQTDDSVSSIYMD